ncbi:MAG TPA: glycosyltransferase family 2 protein [Candidatus Bathyarchaeia archaeon]
MTDVSIFIPVFRESEQLPNLLRDLVSQDISKEIIVTIDEPSDGFLEKVNHFNGVQFIINRERIGKANALNDAAKISSGEILLFLDADIELTGDPDFLKKIVKEMETADVLDLKKKVEKNSFLSKMTYYEYFTFNVGSWITSKCLGKCPAANGAAFAMKRKIFVDIGGFRKVVAEDIDIATRAFLADCSFAYTKEVEVRNIVYSDWKTWYKQRRRWAIGQALWLKDFYKALFRKCVAKPQVFLPAVFVLYPPLIASSLTFLLPSTWVYDSLLVFSLFLSTRFNTVLPVFLFSLPIADVLKIVLISLASFAVTAIVYYKLSKNLGFEMKIHELFVYYFFYSVLWLTIIAISYVQVIAFGKRAAPGWKT